MTRASAPQMRPVVPGRLALHGRECRASGPGRPRSRSLLRDPTPPVMATSPSATSTLRCERFAAGAACTDGSAETADLDARIRHPPHLPAVHHG